MTFWRKVVTLLCTIITLDNVNSKPIVPLGLTFRKVSRLLYDDSNASIGPGLGGSPILVDTSRHTVPRYDFLGVYMNKLFL